MAGLRNNKNTQNAQWADYVGDILRGTQPINQLVPQHPYLNDVPLIDELRHQNTHHVILLTLDVAQRVLNSLTSFDYIHFITTHPSGIKDVLAWLTNASKLTTELDKNGKIIFNFNALKHTKATYFEILGEKYIKVTTSSPWLLDKLGKYIFSSRAPQVLELAVGWRGSLSESIKGVKFCIWFSVAWRTIEFIMSSERDLVNFLGDISMDVVKAVIAGGVATAIGSLTSFACLSFGFPVILVGGAILLTGIVCTIVLNDIDARYHLSDKLKDSIRDGLKRQQEIDKWKRENMTPFMYVLNTPVI